MADFPETPVVPDADDDDATGDIPDPRPIEVDNLAGSTRSPHPSLNGTSLEGRERVALARFEGDSIGRERVPARMSLQLVEAFTRSLDGLAREHGATLLEAVYLDAGVQVLLAGVEDSGEQQSFGANSPAGRGVEQLVNLLLASSLDTLVGKLRGYDDELLRALEHLMRLLVEAQVDLDVQQTTEERPTRLTAQRAYSYLAILQREREDPERPQTFIGRLDGVVAPEGKVKPFFHLTLRTAWNRRRIISGSFAPQLAEEMGDLLYQDVVLRAEVARRQRGERKTTMTFKAIDVRALDQGQTQIPTPLQLEASAREAS